MAEDQTSSQEEALSLGAYELQGIMGSIIADENVAIEQKRETEMPANLRNNSSDFPGPNNTARQGIRGAPPILDINMELVDTVLNDAVVEDLGNKMARTVETEIARKIKDGSYLQTGYFPANKPVTENKKAAMGYPRNRPLLASGLLVNDLENHRLPVEMTWNETVSGRELTVDFGWKKSDDPTHKYWDMLFGATCVGRGHHTKVVARYPRITQDMSNSIEQAVQDWVNSSMAKGVMDPQPGSEFINVMNGSDTDFLDMAGMGDFSYYA